MHDSRTHGSGRNAAAPLLVVLLLLERDSRLHKTGALPEAHLRGGLRGRERRRELNASPPAAYNTPGRQRNCAHDQGGNEGRRYGRTRWRHPARGTRRQQRVRNGQLPAFRALSLSLSPLLPPRSSSPCAGAMQRHCCWSSRAHVDEESISQPRSLALRGSAKQVRTCFAALQPTPPSLVSRVTLGRKG